MLNSPIHPPIEPAAPPVAPARIPAAATRHTSVECPATPAYLGVKRCIDWFCATATLILLGPLIGLLALRVRADSPGPAFFRQARAGWRARPFTLRKFRSMRTDADPFGDSPQHGGDPRITRIGRWLRETSLDELPQLINVVRGEMSLVGPRPLYLQQMGEWNERQRGRLLMPPGLTGLAQINGRGALTIEQKLEWDVRYVESACLKTDLLIIWRTFRNVFRQSGIYEVQYSSGKARRSGR